MSDHLRRPLPEEVEFLIGVARGTSIENVVISALRGSLVEDLSDGGMRSIKFHNNVGEKRHFYKEAFAVEYVDADGVPVSIALNIDETGQLYEVDFFKADFSPLVRYPKAGQVVGKPRRAFEI